MDLFGDRFETILGFLTSYWTIVY